MAFASSVVMFAVSPQNFLSLASAEDSFLLLVDVLSVYGRHICSEIAKKTAANAAKRVAVPRRCSASYSECCGDAGCCIAGA
jgi:hypothetical protein